MTNANLSDDGTHGQAPSGTSPSLVLRLRDGWRTDPNARHLVSADGETVEWGDLLPDGTAESPATGAAQEMLRGRISKVLKTLSYREREIIKLRYGLGDGYSYTLEEVGHIFKVTRERIQQIEAKAVRKLQQPSRSQDLVGFLD